MARTVHTGDKQFAALPYRIGEDGILEVMLITSRETRRWVVPKGWPEKGKKPRQLVKIEAMEEAGVVGIVGRKPIGTYHYSKAMPDGETRLLVVDVYPLSVSCELENWAEANERTRRWFHLDQASIAVSDGGLALIIDALDRTYPAPNGKT